MYLGTDAKILGQLQEIGLQKKFIYDGASIFVKSGQKRSSTSTGQKSSA